MTFNFSIGQRVKLSDLTSSQHFTIQIDLNGFCADLSCFGMDDQGQLSDDRYFIFYNQPDSPERAISSGGDLTGGRASFTLDLTRLPSTLRKLVFTLTVDMGSVAQMSAGALTLLDSRGEQARFAFKGTDFARERALMLLEVYFKDVWRVCAVGQGFDGGLQALLENFGGEVAENPTPPAQPTLPLGVEAFSELSSAASSSQTTNACSRCGQSANLFNRLDSTTRRCGKCKAEVQQKLHTFRQSFIAFCSDGILTLSEWQLLQAELQHSRLDALEALNYVRGDALGFLQRHLSMAEADGEITAQEERDFYRLSQLLKVPPSLITSLVQRLEQLKEAAEIRRGVLPSIQSAIHLESGELCHLEISATYQKVGARAVKHIPGRLTATSKQIYFSSAEGGWSVKYKNVLRVEELGQGVNLELSVKAGSGRYEVEIPLLVGATLDALVRLEKRLLLAPQTERASRHIPQDVRHQVWQRDRAKCVECGSDQYLEFDHIIPHSRGGANTLNNVQLLCRRCNGQKSN